MASAKLDEIAVPDGEPAEIEKFLQELARRQPKGASQEEQIQDFARIQRALVLAAERLLEKSDDEEVRYNAALTKFSALGRLTEMLDDKEAAKEFEKFPDALKNDKAPKVASLGRMAAFGMQMQKWQGDPERKPETVLDGLKELLAGDNLDANVFEIASQTPPLLSSAKFDAESDEAMKLVREAFQDSTLPEAIDWLASTAEVDRMKELQLDEKFSAFMEQGSEALPPLMEAVRKLFAAENPGQMTLAVASRLAGQLEQSREFEAASEVYRSIGETFADHENPDLVEFSKQTSESGVKRLGMFGKPLPVEGVLASGGPFSWDAYKGKYVLVDFWATWCRPCLEELPNIRENYDKYRDKGFDVVGVNIDEDRASAIEFIENEKLPWATVLSSEGETGGNWTHPNVKRCGISEIPFVALLDPEGNVIDIHVRGEKLGRRLAELFPEEGAGAAGAEETGALPRQTWFVAFETPGDEENSEEEAASEEADEAQSDELSEEPEATPSGVEANPYAAPASFTPEQLAEFLLNMQYKPKSIQSRPGFNEAIVEASERLLAAGAPAKYRNMAVLTKLDTLHKQASLGNEPADQALAAYVAELAGEPSAKIARDVQFFELERRVLEAKDMPLDQLPALFAELKDYFAKEKLVARHLRIASATIDAINRLEDGAEREKLYDEFGKLFAASHDKDLELYGKKLVKTPEGAESDVIGKPLELAGTTTQGTEFDWSAYKGKVVLVDFWATWCGPCRKAMPVVKAVYERYKDFGLDIVGVSLDQDQDALAAYLEQNQIAWSTLAGEKTQELATKYGVRGIPTLMLVGKDGLVVAVSHSVEDLAEKARELVGAPPSTEPLPKAESPASSAPQAEPPA